MPVRHALHSQPGDVTPVELLAVAERREWCVNVFHQPVAGARVAPLGQPAQGLSVDVEARLLGLARIGERRVTLQIAQAKVRIRADVLEIGLRRGYSVAAQKN